MWNVFLGYHLVGECNSTFFMRHVISFSEEFLPFDVDTTEIRVCNPPTANIKKQFY